MNKQYTAKHTPKMILRDCGDIMAYAFKDTGVNDYSGHWMEVIRRYTQRAVYKYMCKRYGFAV